jgi:hypothetical protein
MFYVDTIKRVRLNGKVRLVIVVGNAPLVIYIIEGFFEPDRDKQDIT